MKVYVTKNVLTKGIQKVEALNSNELNNNDQIVKSYDAYYIGKGIEWHLTKEAAIKKAEEMRIEKIASLKKQLAKIEALTF